MQKLSFHGLSTALARMPPLVLSLDIMMSLFHYVCSHLMPVPIISVPIMTPIPLQPVSVKVIIVYTIVVWRERVYVLRRYIDDDPWYSRRQDRNPGCVIGAGPEPIAAVVTIPEASKEIYTEGVRNHVDVIFPTRDHYNVRRRGES